MHLTSCGTLAILITGTGELLLYFTVIFFSFHIKKKLLQDCFVLPCVACYFFCRNPCSSGPELESNGTPKGRTI